MIRKLENGTTLITLGQGTVFAGLARLKENDDPIGICFTNQKTEGDPANDSVVIQIETINAVASYIMALIRLLETWDDGQSSKFSKIIEGLKADLQEFMPK